MDTQLETNSNFPRDAFLHVSALITLAASSVAFGALIFQIINYYFPDVLSYEPLAGILDSMRYALASLIIVFPIYVWLMRFLNKDITLNPGKKDLKIRKWLLYLALFAAALTIAGDLISLIYNFLQGELTLRFALKIFTILAIAGVIFIYYKKILNPENIASRTFVIFVLPKIIIGLTAAAIVAGIFIAGLPQNQRLVRFDEQRISDVLSVNSSVENYWSKNKKLPENLNQLETALDIKLPVDPETNSPYEYTRKGDLDFELCAVFQTASRENANVRVLPYGGSKLEVDLRGHSSGKNCFSRKINPANYPLINTSQEPSYIPAPKAGR